MAHYTEKQLLEMLTPKEGNRLVETVLNEVLSSHWAAVAVGGGSASIYTGSNTPFRDKDHKETAAEEALSSLLDLRKGNGIGTEAVLVAKKDWAFSPHVPEEEVEAWEGRVEEHPNAVPILDVVLATRKLRVSWIVTYALEMVMETSTASFWRLRLLHVFEQERKRRVDKRLLPVPEGEEKTREKRRRKKVIKERNGNIVKVAFRKGGARQ